MAAIEPVRKDVTHPGRIKKFSRGLRFWHWANLIIICGSLITVLINKTILQRNSVTPVVTSVFQKSQIKAGNEQANAIAHALSDKVWDVHVYFGYFLAGLLLFRLLLEFFQLADQKFIRILKSAYLHFKATKTNRVARHELAVKTIYAFFYLVLITIVLTGLFLAFEDAMAPYKAYRHTVKDVHNVCMYIVLGFIVIHLTGVFLAERKESKGIVSDMINGGGEALK